MARPLVTLDRFTPDAALRVLSNLDENDQLEAQLMRGDSAAAYDMLADWMMLARQGAVCFIGAATAPISEPVAVLGILPGTTPGLGHVAMLARDHRFWKRVLVPLAREIRDRLPTQARAMGLHRLEAHSWAAHPTAASLLTAIGFRLDARMTGFGPSGCVYLNQWSWLADYVSPLPDTPTDKEI